MDALFEIRLQLAPKGSRDAARMIFEQLRDAIIAGRLAPETRLPSARRAKDYFGVSRNTMAEVYERLRLVGLVSTRAGSGSYVAHHARPPRSARRVQTAPTGDPRLNAFWRTPETRAALNFWQDEPSARATAADIDLRPALVDSRLFPFDLFRQINAKGLRKLEHRPPRLKSPQGNQGNYHLRQQVANHLALTRGVACDAEAILITAGAQQAFDIIARTLISPARRTVAVEDPGYPPLRVPFAAAGGEVVPVRVDAEGLVLEALPPHAAVICVCPSHQFPLGSSMSPRRRRALLDFARIRGAVIVEDDYDGEFRHAKRAIEPLRNEDTDDVVIYVGTFSKCMLPSLRLGYVLAPPWALDAMIAAKNSMDWHCPTPLQVATADFIAGGHLARHVRRMRKIYEERRRFVADVIHDRLPAWLELVPSAYGMHVAAFTRESTSSEQIASHVAARGVRLHSLERFYLGPERRGGFVFGIGVADTDALRQGLKQVQLALEKSGRSSRQNASRAGGR